ncbi:hypothetical protein ACFLSJ_04910 [Verrucomicrobiota bacterium]
MRMPDGTIWQVQATWIKSGRFLFQGREFSGKAFRKQMAEDGIPKGMAIRIACEPGAGAPVEEWQAFRDAGFGCAVFLHPDEEQWLKDKEPRSE